MDGGDLCEALDDPAVQRGDGAASYPARIVRAPVASPKWLLSRRDHTPKQEEQLECSRELVLIFFHPFLISRLHSEAPAVRPAN